MNAYRLSWHGLTTVTALELKQRIRSRRWIVALIGWFLIIGGVTSLIIAATSRTWSDPTAGPAYGPGPIAFGWITYFVLGMGLVIAPAFTATSINGDRDGGTLALLQATKLSATEIALGKLIAAWFAAGVFLLVALPFIAWSMLLGSISLWQVIVCFTVVFLEVAVVCAIGLGWSALINRTAGSTVLTYLSVVALTILAPMVMGLLMPFTQTRDSVRVWGMPPAALEAYQQEVDRYWSQHPNGDGSGVPAPPLTACAWNDVVEQRAHPERVWWLTVANPFVVVADAAPLPPGAEKNLGSYAGSSGDPLAGLRLAVRWMSIPQSNERDNCADLYGMSPAYRVEYDQSGNVTRVTTASGTEVPFESPVKRQPVTVDRPLWPWGLGVNLALGLVFFWVAVKRLQVPYGVLPKGIRVA